jgi:hypothetical protein
MVAVPKTFHRRARVPWQVLALRALPKFIFVGFAAMGSFARTLLPMARAILLILMGKVSARFSMAYFTHFVFIPIIGIRPAHFLMAPLIYLFEIEPPVRLVWH